MVSRPWHRRPKGDARNSCDRADANIIATAKRIGMSLQELDMLTLQDFLDIVHAYMGEDPDAPREATQEDIDMFYRM